MSCTHWRAQRRTVAAGRACEVVDLGGQLVVVSVSFSSRRAARRAGRARPRRAASPTTRAATSATIVSTRLVAVTLLVGALRVERGDPEV
ncbi:hypothetical protein ACFQX7_38780, partial [Luedemannella flava]